MTENCHGCKYLDRYQEDGNGYCAMVVRAEKYHSQFVENGKLMPSACVRRPNMECCELYAEGVFERRYTNENPKTRQG